ncbi:hypothetical protein [Geobacter sp. AOG2]|uniref:hypothetical protein n=1 Tax=Geobacter sp. AOG2 TaxID=1566347 RepID=UPI001CC40E47|nr:hypothetical protein [Geobacter sp. AOG2]GFE60393.1 hypothetical protein AOG2_09810 [Geobacter sp. AOG2]
MGKKIRNSIEIVVEQFQNLFEKCLQTKDEHERVILVRRLVNLVGVIQFLISVQKVTPHI